MLVGHAQIAQRPLARKVLGKLGYLLSVAQIAQWLTAAWLKTDLLGHCPNYPTLATPTSCYVITFQACGLRLTA